MFNFIKGIVSFAYYFLTTPGRIIGGLLGFNAAASDVLGVVVAIGMINWVGLGTYVLICAIPVIGLFRLGAGFIIAAVTSK